MHKAQKNCPSKKWQIMCMTQFLRGRFPVTLQILFFCKVKFPFFPHMTELLPLPKWGAFLNNIYRWDNKDLNENEQTNKLNVFEHFLAVNFHFEELHTMANSIKFCALFLKNSCSSFKRGNPTHFHLLDGLEVNRGRTGPAHPLRSFKIGWKPDFNSKCTQQTPPQGG